VINAPDIRWKTLSEHVIEELKNPAAVYDLAMFKTAVEQGRHPDGDELDTVMPRWNMSDADLADLAQFLKTLP
jgi:mono/diheme cytochrome c family protein